MIVAATRVEIDFFVFLLQKKNFFIATDPPRLFMSSSAYHVFHDYWCSLPQKHVAVWRLQDTLTSLLTKRAAFCIETGDALYYHWLEGVRIRDCLWAHKEYPVEMILGRYLSPLLLQQVLRTALFTMLPSDMEITCHAFLIELAWTNHPVLRV